MMLIMTMMMMMMIWEAVQLTDLLQEEYGIWKIICKKINQMHFSKAVHRVQLKMIFIGGKIISFFRDYSSSGPKGHAGSKPYQYIYRTEYGSYAFNGIDLNPDPGPKRPFNFFGHVDPVGT